MSTRLGTILREQRGSDTRAEFARRLERSYTYIRALELGLRSPSDRVLEELAEKLSLDPGELIIAAYCDRSPRLTEALIRRGVVEREPPESPDARPEPSAESASAGSAVADPSLQAPETPGSKERVAAEGSVDA